MKHSLQLLFCLFIISIFTSPLLAQNGENVKDFSDRESIANAVDNFFIGDHTGSIKHKKLSMLEGGAYRSVDRDGNYYDSVFNLDSDDSDTSYQEELLGIEIYGSLALAKLRLENKESGIPHYKVLTLHKVKNDWKITTITWGFAIKE